MFISEAENSKISGLWFLRKVCLGNKLKERTQFFTRTLWGKSKEFNLYLSFTINAHSFFLKFVWCNKYKCNIPLVVYNQCLLISNSHTCIMRVTYNQTMHCFVIFEKVKFRRCKEHQQLFIINRIFIQDMANCDFKSLQELWARKQDV